MKSVLISIKPKYCELIASGKKTVEIRKTRPKLETPFKCYIYCTSKYDKSGDGYFQGKYCGKVIGEFVCDHIYPIAYTMDGFADFVDCQTTCLNPIDFINYGKGQTLYGWHISDLVIYDKPKKISYFQKPCNHYNDCSTCKRFDRKDYACICGVTRPPQSWCYVEEL